MGKTNCICDITNTASDLGDPSSKEENQPEYKLSWWLSHSAVANAVTCVPSVLTVCLVAWSLSTHLLVAPITIPD